MLRSNENGELNVFERIDAILFDPEINMRPKLAALVALRRENKDTGSSWASNLTYAAAVGSTDPRAGGRARQSAVREGLISARQRPGRSPIVQMNNQRIYSIHDRLNAERANRRIYSVHDLASNATSNSNDDTPAISHEGAAEYTTAISHHGTPSISHDTAPANSDDTPLPFPTTKRANNRQLNDQGKEQVAASATQSPLAGANSSEKSGDRQSAGTGRSEDPPIPPATHVDATTKPSVRIEAATIGPGFGNDLNNLNPHAHMVRQNRRYGALTMLDGSEGVSFDVATSKLTLSNEVQTEFAKEAAEKGLNLEFALTRAATKIAKTPKSATAMLAKAEIRDALHWQERDRRAKATSSTFRRGWSGRGRFEF